VTPAISDAGDQVCGHSVAFIDDIPVAEVVDEALDLLAAYRAEPKRTGHPIMLLP
jgi:hypothetical protein